MTSPGQRIRNVRFLPIDTYPWAVDFVQQPIGKALLCATFALAMVPIDPVRGLPITGAAAACAYAGRYRNVVRTLATLSILLTHPHWFSLYWPPEMTPRDGVAGRIDLVATLWPMLTIVFVLSAMAMRLVRRFRNAPLARHPIVGLHVFFAGAVAIASSGVLERPLQSMLWVFIASFGAYFWFLCYALADQRARDASAPLVQFGVFHPFWGSSTTPIGKGAAYLRKVEAKDPRELAITQLKGLKLLLWVHLLTAVDIFYGYVSHSILNIPTLANAFAQHMAGHSYPWYVCWASLIQNFFGSMLEMAIWGGPIVAVARLAGYRLLRNTRRPLTSTTLVEFWNRYYFFYKELLVDIFFFPTFFSCFRAHSRMRIFFATVMAATVGNFIFHFVRDIGISAQLGVFHQLRGFQTFGFYCIALGIGIGVSQMRIQHRKRYKPGAARSVAASAGVLAFYCVLSIFSDTYSEYSLADHFSFLLHVAGLGTWK